MTDPVIHFYGDSFVEGFGDPTGLGWVGRVRDLSADAGLSFEIANYGVQGAMASEVALECRTRLQGDDAGAVVVSFGTNDVSATGTRALDHVSLRMQEILLEMLPSCPAAVVGVPPVADAAVTGLNAQLNERLRGAASDCGVRFFDVFDRLRGGHSWVSQAADGDGAHPDAAGYYEFAEAVMAVGWLDWLRAWR